MSPIQLRTHTDNQLLNMAAFIPDTRVLGPGLRAGIWLQGCPLNCMGCIAPEWQSYKTAISISVSKLVEKINHIPHIQGLTISGGEPMIQADLLSEVIRQVRLHRQIDVIVFTGFTITQLLQNPPSEGILTFLKQIDLLIDGPFIANENDGSGLRGSTNQNFIHLTPRFKENTLANLTRSIEIRIDLNEVIIVGIPPNNFGSLLDQTFADESNFKVRQ